MGSIKMTCLPICHSIRSFPMDFEFCKWFTCWLWRHSTENKRVLRRFLRFSSFKWKKGLLFDFVNSALSFIQFGLLLYHFKSCFHNLELHSNLLSSSQVSSLKQKSGFQYVSPTPFTTVAPTILFHLVEWREASSTFYRKESNHQWHSISGSHF